MPYPAFFSEAWGKGEAPFSHAGTLGGVGGKYTYTDDCSTKLYIWDKKGLWKGSTPSRPLKHQYRIPRWDKFLCNKVPSSPDPLDPGTPETDDLQTVYPLNPITFSTLLPEFGKTPTLHRAGGVAYIYIYDRETFRDYLPSLFLSLIYIGFKEFK